jgi:hypothetical protein
MTGRSLSRSNEPVSRRRDWLDLLLILTGALVLAGAGMVFLLFLLYLAL